MQPVNIPIPRKLVTRGRFNEAGIIIYTQDCTGSLLLITAVPGWGGRIRCEVPRQDGSANRTAGHHPVLRSGAQLCCLTLTKANLRWVRVLCTLPSIPSSVWQEGRTRGASASTWQANQPLHPQLHVQQSTTARPSWTGQQTLETAEQWASSWELSEHRSHVSQNLGGSRSCGEALSYGPRGSAVRGRS